MNAYKKSFLFLFILLLYRCKVESIKPIANFEIIDYNIYKEQYYAGSTINFGNKSEFAETYLWDFGDNSYSDSVNSSHKYKLPGSYKVTLTVYNKSEKSSDFKIIEVQVDRFSLLINKWWKLIGKKQNGKDVQLDNCDRNFRIKFTENYKLIKESVDTCNQSEMTSWYFDEGNIICENVTLGSWYCHDFLLTKNLLILKMPWQYEFIYKSE